MNNKFDPIEFAWQKAASRLGFNKLPISHFLVLRGVFYGGFKSAWELMKALETQPEEKRIALIASVEESLEKEIGKKKEPERKIIL